MDQRNGVEIQRGQGMQIPAVILQHFLHRFQVGDGLVQLIDFLGKEVVKGFGTAVVQKLPDFLQRHIQFPEHENGLQGSALLIAVTAIAVFTGADGLEQTNFVIPHQGLFVDFVQGGKFSNGK